MEWYKVHDEAEQLEHAVSAEFERRLQEKLGAEERSVRREPGRFRHAGSIGVHAGLEAVG